MADDDNYDDAKTANDVKQKRDLNKNRHLIQETGIEGVDMESTTKLEKGIIRSIQLSSYCHLSSN